MSRTNGGGRARARGGRSGRRSRRRRGARALLWLLGLGCLAAGGWAAMAWATWPDVARLATERPDTTAFMRRYLERRAEQPELPPLRWTWIPLSTTSVHAQRAAVSAEDMEFFHHGGFSTSEIRAAIQDALSGDDLRGASTITQQLAKNLWLTPSRNPMRKVREALLTRQLERDLTKRRILEIYLNVVELGTGIYGVEAASRHYFGRSASSLTEREAAMLAASLPRPSSWHPGVESRAYAGYVDDIVARMGRAEFLWRFVGGEIPIEASPTPVDTALLGAPRLPDPAVFVAPLSGTAVVPSPLPDTVATVPPDTGAAVPRDTVSVVPPSASAPPRRDAVQDTGRPLR